MVEVVDVTEGVWRVVVAGSAVGLVHRFAARDGIRYMARRVDRERRCWVRLGEYWEFERAVAALALPV